MRGKNKEAMGKSKQELINAVSYSKLPMREIEARLRKAKGNVSFDRLLSQENPGRISRPGEVSKLEGGQGLFNLERLCGGVGGSLPQGNPQSQTGKVALNSPIIAG